jgi:hypothetical protein
MSTTRLLLELVAPVADLPPARLLAMKYLPLLLFMVVLAVLLVKAVRVWQEIHDVEEPATPGELLASLEEAHAAGELDDVEIARVRQQFANCQTDGTPAALAKPTTPNRLSVGAPPAEEPYRKGAPETTPPP